MKRPDSRHQGSRRAQETGRGPQLLHAQFISKHSPEASPPPMGGPIPTMLVNQAMGDGSTKPVKLERQKRNLSVLIKTYARHFKDSQL